MPKKGEPLSPEQKARMEAGRAAARAAKKDQKMVSPSSLDSNETVLALQKQVENLTKMVDDFARSRGGQGLIGDDLVAAVRKAADGRTTEVGMVQEEYIPDGDYIEPVLYYTPTNNWNLWHKQVGNHYVPPPFGWKRIRFERSRAWSERDRSGSGLKQKFISTFICRSATISKWLESTPEFGRVFYRNVQQALNASDELQFATLFAKHFGALDITYGQLTALAAENGVGTDVAWTRDDYRGKLAEIFAKREVAASKAQFRDSQQRARAEDLLVEKGVPQHV